MRAKGSGALAAQKRPASPANDSDDSSATQSTKKRRVRRPALSNDEDMAILRAVLAIQPYRASWGQGRLKWLQTAAHVSAATGGEMSDDLCKGRYVNLLKRFTTPQEERKRPWPKDEELTKLLEEAVAEQTKYESEVKDEYDEKGNQRRKWQPLQAMRKPGGGGATVAVEKVSEDERERERERKPAAETTKTAKPTATRTGTRGPYKKRIKVQQDELQAVDAQDAATRLTRWTAPTPGARAPVLGTAPAPPVASAASSLASALASRAVASMTGSRATSSPVKLAPGPTPGSSSTAPPGSTAPPVSTSAPGSTSAPISTPAATVTATPSGVAAPVSRPNPAAFPSILRGLGPARESLLPGRQQQLPTPAPWLRPVLASRDSTPIARASTPPTSTPPRDTKPDIASMAPASAPRPASASPREQPPVDRSRFDRNYLTSRDNARPRPEFENSARQPASMNNAIDRDTRTEVTRDTRETSNDMASGVPARTLSTVTPTRQAPTQLSMPHRLGLVPPLGRLPLSHTRYSPPVSVAPARDSTQSTPPRGAPVSRSASPALPMTTNTAPAPRDTSVSVTHTRYSPPVPARDSTQSTPPRGAPASRSASPSLSTTANTAAAPSVSHTRYSPPAPATPVRDSTQSSLSRPAPATDRSFQSQASEARANSSGFPRFQGATSIESMMLCVLDRLSDMEKARLEDTREERELKKRELEMRASPNGSNQSDELEDLRRTTMSLSTSFAVSHQVQQELQSDVKRLGSSLQVNQRERAQLQQDVSLLTTQLKTAHRERDELKSDLEAVVKTVKLLQSALLQQDEAFENFKRVDAVDRRRQRDAQQEIVARQLDQFQDTMQADRKKREDVLALIQKERDLNEAQHRERLRQLDARASGPSKQRSAGDASTSTSVPVSVEAELAELRVAIDVERSEREREYTTLLQNIKQILATDQTS